MPRSKICFKCNIEKPITEFYKHPAMSDGVVGKCKECNKADVTANRSSKIEYYRRYDRDRGSRLTADDVRFYRKKKPNAYHARCLVGYAKKIGSLKVMPCEVCGSMKSTHAHHDDYDKPLEVRWLCPEHHFKWHKENGEGRNA